MTQKLTQSSSQGQMFKREAKNLFRRAKEEGLWTHAYGAWGSLDPKGEVFKVADLPDHREVFDLASLTKAVVTTSLIFQELNRGSVSLSSTLGEWLGDLWPGRLSRVLSHLSLESLLGHHSGLPAWSNFWINHWLPDGQTDQLRELPGLTGIERHLQGLSRRPLGVQGEELYSDLGFILLGLALGLKKQQSLASQWNDWLTKDLKIGEQVRDLDFSPSGELRDRCVPTSYCYLRKRLLVGEVHDENCASLGGVSGHAGLFGSGESLTTYLQALFHSKVGETIFRENQKRLQQRRRSEKQQQKPSPSLLGWRPADDPSSMGFGGGRAFGHMGFTGVAFWVRPHKNDFAMLLTNRICSGRLSRKITEFRREFFNLAGTLG